MTPKDNFLQDKRLSDWLRATVATNDFQRCLVFAKAEMMSSDGVTSDMMKGANQFEQILLSIADIPSESPRFTSGLDHDINNPQPKAPTP